MIVQYVGHKPGVGSYGVVYSEQVLFRGTLSECEAELARRRQS